jgi:hypothetical protein
VLEREIARHARAYERTLTETATVYRPSQTVDRYGAVRRGVEAAVATYRCRVAAASERDLAAIGGRLDEGAAYRIRFPRGADIAVGDRIEVGGRSYRVTAVFRPSLGIATTVIAYAA